MEAILCNNIKVIRYINKPVPSNAYLLIDGTGKHCIVIDPGSKKQDGIINFIKAKGLKLDYILLTHEHFDHCWGVNDLISTFQTRVVATKMCADWVKTPRNYFNKLYFDSDEMYSIDTIDIILEDINWFLDWRGVKISFMEAKGHTNRGMCVNIGNSLFSGDTMIYNTRPFLKKKYGASIEDLYNTISRIYSTFEDDIIVFPGHGEIFKLKEMRSFYDNYFAEMKQV